MALQFNVDAVAAKGLEQSLRAVVILPRSLKRCRSRKERDQSRRKFFQFAVAHQTASLFAPQMCLSQEGAKVCVTDPIFHQHGQESAILHRQVRADDRMYSLLSAGDRKPLCAVNTIAIEQRNGGQSELSCTLDELLRERTGAEKTEGAA